MSGQTILEKIAKEKPELLNKMLITASKENEIEQVKTLLKLGTDVNFKDNFGETALIWASSKGHKEIVKILVDEKANVNIKDNDGHTALVLASGDGHKEIMELLKQPKDDKKEKIEKMLEDINKLVKEIENLL